MEQTLTTLARLVQSTYAIREASYVPMEMSEVGLTSERIPLSGGYYGLSYNEAYDRAVQELSIGDADAVLLTKPVLLMLSYPGEAIEWAAGITGYNYAAAAEDAKLTAIEEDEAIPHFVS